MNSPLKKAYQNSQSSDICKNYHKENSFSVSAYESIKHSKAQLRNDIHKYIISCKEKGATCDEIEVAFNQAGKSLTHQSASARCTELKSLNLVYESGGRRTRTGRRAAVLVSVQFKQGALF